MLPFTLTLLLGFVAQGPAQDTPAGRLDFMRASLENDSLHVTGDPKSVFTLRKEPVLCAPSAKALYWTPSEPDAPLNL